MKRVHVFAAALCLPAFFSCCTAEAVEARETLEAVEAKVESAEIVGTGKAPAAADATFVVASVTVAGGVESTELTTAVERVAVEPGPAHAGASAVGQPLKSVAPTTNELPQAVTPAANELPQVAAPATGELSQIVVPAASGVPETAGRLPLPQVGDPQALPVTVTVMGAEFFRRIHEAQLYFPRQETAFGFTDTLLESDLSAPEAEVAALVEVHFPYGLGRPTVDLAVRNTAGVLYRTAAADIRSTVAGYRRSAREAGADSGHLEIFGGEAQECPLTPEGMPAGHPGCVVDEFRHTFYSVTTYEISQPSARIVSVRFQTTGYEGGAHEMWTFRCITLDRISGRELGLEDIFFNAKSALPQLEKAVDAGMRRLRQERDDTPIENTGDYNGLTGEADLKMKRIDLVPEGLRVTYDPYEQGSFAYGEFEVVVPLANLLRMGARPQLWGR